MESLERELAQIEQARAVAAVQQEAQRIAAALDQTRATQQNQAQVQAATAKQEEKLQALGESIKREVRTESLQQLKDVTSMFVQHFKANRIAHAEVQTYMPEPPQPPPDRIEYGTQVDLLRSSQPVLQKQPRVRDSLAATTIYSDDFASAGEDGSIPTAIGAPSTSMEVSRSMCVHQRRTCGPPFNHWKEICLVFSGSPY